MTDGRVMTARAAVALYRRIAAAGIGVWIVGGWCVDALVGRQTREHADLDIAVRRGDGARLRGLLEAAGYAEEPRDDSCEFMYVLTNAAGESVDVHVFEYDEHGEIAYGVPFPVGSLTGTGVIDGCAVACVAPEFMARFLTGYELRAQDRHDRRVLRDHFGLAVPGGDAG